MRQASGLPAAALAEARASGEILVEFGEDCDVDADGTIYIADRAANSIQVYSKDGKPLRTIPVAAPVAVAALAEGEGAVGTSQKEALETVFDRDGRFVRQ